MSQLSDWPVLVLTAGLATRLRPLSLIRAKAAMPVAGTPIIGRILDWLRDAGVRRVVLNLHHRPETITRLVGDGSAWGLEVRYSWESTILGSAGGPRHALPLLETNRFLIVNGDTLTTCDLKAVVTRHLDTHARVTMAVVPGDVARYGGVIVDDNDAALGFARAHESVAPDASVWHFIGVQAVDASVFADLPDAVPAETIRALYPELIRMHPDSVVAFRSHAEFLDVGTPRDYMETVALLAAREQRPFDSGDGVNVEPGARLVQTILWDRVSIGSNAQLNHCIVADDVQVPAGARYDNSVLIAGTHGVEVHGFS